MIEKYGKIGGGKNSPELFSGERILVSACLVGWKCRYDGGDRLDKSLILQGKRNGWSFVPACPEVLGGLSVPRKPCVIEIGDGFDALDGKSRVIDSAGADVTKHFIDGAKRTAELATSSGCKCAVLKDKSPSCGATIIKDNSGRERKGFGVTAAMLNRIGIKIIESR